MATATAQATHAEDRNTKAPVASKGVVFDKALYEKLRKDDDEGTLSDDDHDRYVAQIQAKHAETAADRKKLADVVKVIKDSGYPFAKIYKAAIAGDDGLRAEISSLFTDEEIAAANKGGAKVSKGPKKPSTGAKNPPGTILPGTLIRIETGSRPTVYMKGNGAKLGSYTQTAIKALADKHGDKLEQVLIDNHATEEGKAYFATKEGKDELKVYADHARSKPAQAKKK